MNQLENMNKRVDFIKEFNISYTQDILMNLLLSSGISYTEKFFIGMCFGFVIEEEKYLQITFENYMLMKINIYNEIQDFFQLSNNGFVVKKEECDCNLIAVIPTNEKTIFIEKYVNTIINIIKTKYDVTLRIGIGIPTDDFTKLRLSHITACFAYNFYFFEPKNIIEYVKLKKQKTLSFKEVYEQLTEEVFCAILSKSDTVYKKVNEVLEAVENMYYGEKDAAISRCIMFVGELCKKLKDLNPNKANWRIEQQNMQEILKVQTTYQEVSEIIIRFFKELIPIIYQSIDKNNINEIINIKKYIRENFRNNLTLKEMANIMCVTESYFCAQFKNVTGKNFKAYITEIRMEKALNLILRTNMKTYEISDAVGYNETRRFVDTFKKIYNMTPMEYRKLHN